MKHKKYFPMRQCSLQNGGMCLGLKLVVRKDAIEQVMKELLYACQKASLRVRWDEDTATGLLKTLFGPKTGPYKIL